MFLDPSVRHGGCDRYCDLLGFEIAQNSGEVEAPEGRFFHWARLRLGGAGLMLNTSYETGDGPAPAIRRGRRA